MPVVSGYLKIYNVHGYLYSSFCCFLKDILNSSLKVLRKMRLKEHNLPIAECVQFFQQKLSKLAPHLQQANDIEQLR